MHASLRLLPVTRALALTAAVLMSAGAPAHAGEQAERALAAVQRLVASGEIKAGAVLKLKVKQGNIASFVGRENELRKDWEQRTGILIDASVMPQLDSLDFIRQSKDLDITIARNHEYPDLIESGLIEDLAPLLQRFGFTLAEDGAGGYILPRLQALYDQQVAAIPADMDLVLMYLRRDLLEDAGQRARFREQHGRELRAPRIWAEYQTLVEFFHRPAEGFYGALEPREPLTAWMYWMPRYSALAAPNQHLFDDAMKPLVDSPAGVAATESYLATLPYSPPEILAEGKDYSYTLPFFLRGKGFSTFITIAGAKLAQREGSAVRGKFVAQPVPGQLSGGRLVRRPTFIYGNNLVVPRGAPNKLLAFLYAMWLTDPDVSVRAVRVAGGFADPFRYNHLGDETIRALYTPEALAVLREQLPFATPAGTGLPGNAEYLAALGRNLWLASGGKFDAAQAMRRTAQEWEAITERHGRAKQIEHWKRFKALYPKQTEAGS